MDEWYAGIYNHIQMVNAMCLSRMSILKKEAVYDISKLEELDRLLEVKRANDRTEERFGYWFNPGETQTHLPF